MSNKLLKIIALSAAIFSFSANAADDNSNSSYSSSSTSPWSVQFGAGKTFAIRENKDLVFDFGTGIGSTTSIVNETKLDNGFLFFGGVNYAIMDGFKLGAELSYRVNDQVSKENEETKLKGKFWTALAKGTYEFNLGTKVTPFVGAGIGFSRVKYDFNDGVNEFSDLKKTKLAYMATAGAKIDLKDNIGFGVDYAYRATADLEGNDEEFKDVNGSVVKFDKIRDGSHNVEAFVEFKF